MKLQNQEHKDAFMKVAVGFLCRERYNKRFAEQEAFRFMNLEGDVMGKPNRNHPYVKANRKGDYGVMNRKEKVALVTLFQNAVEHAFYGVQ